MKLAFLSIIAMICAGSLAVYYVMKPAPQFAGIIDPSLSAQRDCDGIDKAVERMVSTGGAQDGSTLTLLAVGSGPQNPEPVRVFDKPVPIEPDNVFGNDKHAFEVERASYFKGAVRACQDVAPTKNSPILRAVRAAIAHLRSRGCSPASHCALTAQTDLEDDYDAKLAPVIQKAAKDASIALPAELAGSIDNAGIHIQFCGTSQIQSRRNPKRHATPETLNRLWLGLFTHPELVSFQPYCGD